MSETAAILTWFGIVSVVGLNGFAAGAAAILYLWRRNVGRGARVLLASALAGLLPASVFVPMSFTQREFLGGEGPLVAGLAFSVFLVIAGVVALPGAVVVTRKLEKPGDEYRFFE